MVCFHCSLSGRVQMAHRGTAIRGAGRPTEKTNETLVIDDACCWPAGPSASAQSWRRRLNDYPTSRRGRFTCLAALAANAAREDVLIKLHLFRSPYSPPSCRYEKYVEAETVLSLRFGRGGRAHVDFSARRASGECAVPT